MYIILFFPAMIIGLSGKMGAGKDTVADLLQEMHPEMRRASFALRVKQVVALLTGTSAAFNATAEGKQSVAPGYEDTGMTLGRMQQLVGQGMRDVVCDDIWVRSVLNEAAAADAATTIITDVRYPNEVLEILKRGGAVYRIVRDVSGEFTAGRDTEHPSETALDHFPASAFTGVIANDGTLSELRAKVRVLLGAAAPAMRLD